MPVDVRYQLEMLLRKYPNDLRLIRSAGEANEVNIRNVDWTNAFDNYDAEIITTIERALSDGRQVAVSAAGPKKVMVLAAKPGTPLFGGKDSRDVAAGEIMNRLEELRGRYKDIEDRELLTGGFDSYIYPEKFAALAAKFNFAKYKNFRISDMSIIGEVKRHLDNGKMVIVAAWGEEKGVDVYVEPDYTGGGAQGKSGGCFIATAAFGSRLAPEVIAFSRFRDEVLLQSRAGARFVKLYYCASPPLARLISRSDFLRRAAIVLLLSPMLHLLKMKTRGPAASTSRAGGSENGDREGDL